MSGSEDLEDLIPLDGRPLDADLLDAALGKATSDKPVDLGHGLRLEPGVGRFAQGLTIVKDKGSVGSAASLSTEDQYRLRGFLQNPALFQNDLMPRDGILDDLRDDPRYAENDLIPWDD